MAMFRFRRAATRYQRDQQIARIGTVVCLLVVAAVSWAYHRSSGQLDAPEDSAETTNAPLSVTAWLNRSEPSINDLVAARNRIAAAAADRDLAGTGAACRSATGAVANLHQQMPSPEPTVDHTLQEAIGSYDIGLPYCISATQTQDGAGMQRAATYISQGDAAMRVALDYLGNVPGGEPRDLGVLIV